MIKWKIWIHSHNKGISVRSICSFSLLGLPSPSRFAVPLLSTSCHCRVSHSCCWTTQLHLSANQLLTISQPPVCTAQWPPYLSFATSRFQSRFSSDDPSACSRLLPSLIFVCLIWLSLWPLFDRVKTESVPLHLSESILLICFSQPLHKGGSKRWWCSSTEFILTFCITKNKMSWQRCQLLHVPTTDFKYAKKK